MTLGLLVRWDLDRRDTLTVTSASFAAAPGTPANDDSSAGRHPATSAVYGLLLRPEADGLATQLARTDTPAASTPDTPWAAVAVRPGGRLAATCSTMLPSGLFWAWGGSALSIGTDPLGVAVQSGNTELDPDYIAGFAHASFPADRTPYRGVRRLPPGRTCTWPAQAGAEPATTIWLGPEVWPAPTLSGPRAERSYTEAFDAVVADLAERAGRTGSLAATVSGGLDSTFVASSLARATSGAPLLTLTHVPCPEAGPATLPGRDADERALVADLVTAYPERLRPVALVNTEADHPLDATYAAARAAGVPVFATANQIWLAKVRAQVRAHGGDSYFTGQHGNAAYSHSHPYAAAYYLRRGRVLTAASVGRGPATPWTALLRANLSPQTWQAAALPGSDQARAGRPEYLEWLAGGHTHLPAAGNPRALGGLWSLDPFASRRILDLAAAITPAEWRRGGGTRSFARRVAAGRVPDSIRLRTRRGIQSWDAWFLIRDDRERYLDDLRAIASTPVLAECVDHRELLRSAEQWPWGQPSGPPMVQVLVTTRLLGLAQFCRDHSG